MKYTCEIIINKPVNKVIELFDNPDNLSKWMPGITEFIHLSGTPGQPGAKSKITFDQNGRKMEMIETVTTRNLPDEFSGTYEMKGVYNIIINRFISIDNNTTKYVCESEFQFSGFLKIISWIMPGAFKKQTEKNLQNFKKFVESE